MTIFSGFNRLLTAGPSYFLLSGTLIMTAAATSPAASAGLCEKKPLHPNCQGEPPPPPEDDPPSEVEIAVKWTPPSGGTNHHRPCTPNSFGNNGGQYHCQHQDTRPPIAFDFTGVYWDQTKKNGDDRLCDAMNGISMVANASHQLYWEGSCKSQDGCQIYTEVWFNGPDVQPNVAANAGADATAVDFVRMKAIGQVALGSTDDANPYANDLNLTMDTAQVRFIKVGSNKDAAVCVYDWTVSGTGAPLVLETLMIE